MTKGQHIMLTYEAYFTWTRSLPVWAVNLLNATGKCVHSTEVASLEKAKRDANEWAAKQGLNVEPGGPGMLCSLSLATANS